MLILLCFVVAVACFPWLTLIICVASLTEACCSFYLLFIQFYIAYIARLSFGLLPYLARRRWYASKQMTHVTTYICLLIAYIFIIIDVLPAGAALGLPDFKGHSLRAPRARPVQSSRTPRALLADGACC